MHHNPFSTSYTEHTILTGLHIKYTMTNPPTSPHFLLSFPNPHTLLVTINRPNQRNSIPSDAHWDAHALFSWFDEEPSLLVAIITGAGDKAFCAGQDLTEQNARKNADRRTAAQDAVLNHPPSGFLGLSQRKGKKPVLAAVNGFALGGGFETCLNWYEAFSYSYVSGVFLLTIAATWS